jgi:aldehyde:ferredoxin oxidoreductase
VAADTDMARGLGLMDFSGIEKLDSAKVKATMFSQFYFSLMDTLTLCDFCWGLGALYNFKDIEQFIESVTGWQVTFWELMRAGERRINLMKVFNAREGFDRSQDRLPDRVFEPIPDGPSKGSVIDPDEMKAAQDQYYSMMNWDLATGKPTRAKLEELGLDWVLDT